jgi:integrase
MRGHIRKRTGAKGVAWQVIVTTEPDPITGRARQISATARTKRDAETTLTRLLTEVQSGRHNGPDVTMGELLDRWYKVATPDWSPKTVVETRRFIENYIRPHLGNVKLHKITTASLDDFYARLRVSGGRDGKPLAPSSVRRVHVVVRRSLVQARKWGWLVDNPAADATPGRVRKAEINPPDPNAVVKLIARAEQEEPDFGVFLRLAASSGARRGELCALQWGDVNLDTATLIVRRSLIDGEHGYVEKDTKTHAARRLALDPAMVTALRAHRARQLERALACGVGLGADARVFTYTADASVPWRPDGVTARFVRLRDKEGLPGVRLHDLRHFVATRMLAAGVGVTTVAGRLGHANTATTLNVYAHFVEAADRDAADALGKLLEDTKRASS